MANYTPDKLKVSKNGDNYIYDFAAKMNASLKGAANGVAELDSTGKVPSSQLPSYVDDVLEYASTSAFPATGETGKIYVALDTNKTYRWSGSEYVEISASLALGETSSTAYRGDRGATAYSHATDASRLTTAQTSGLYKIATTAEGHVAGVTAVAKSDITALGIPAQDTTYSAFTGADGTSAGASGLVPAPTATDNTKYLKGDGTWSTVDALPSVTSSDNDKVLEVVNGAWATGAKKIDKEYPNDDWIAKTWAGLTSFLGTRVWTDGENYYYSYSSSQYILDKSTSTWSTKTWTGLNNFSGADIWTDGENIYRSSGNYHNILDKSTSTWTTKTWNGLTNFYGSYVWSDGTNTYYSASSGSYVLDKSTSTWTAKTWSGKSSIDGTYIWTDGINVYYCAGESQYVLDKSTSTWVAKTWSGYTSINGLYVWTDGTTFYYSNGGNQYSLDSSTSTWSAKTWTGKSNIDGSKVWTDGENVYYSDNSDQYEFNSDTSDKILFGQNGTFKPISATGLVLPSVTSSDNGKLLQVVNGVWAAVSLPNASGVSF